MDCIRTILLARQLDVELDEESGADDNDQEQDALIIDADKEGGSYSCLDRQFIKFLNCYGHIFCIECIRTLKLTHEWS